MMTDAHAKHLSDALDLIQQSAAKAPPQPVRLAMSLSLCSEAIAQNLSDAQHLAVGADPRPLKELVPSQAAFFRARAEQAIDDLDAESVRASMKVAMDEMENGEYRQPFNAARFAQEAIEHFLTDRARPKVDIENFGCQWCGLADGVILDYDGRRFHRDCYNDAAEARNVRS